ncbi:MAG: STAS domain-containing protein [Mycobacterium sp.]
MIQPGTNGHGMQLAVPKVLDHPNPSAPRPFDVRAQSTRDVMVVTATGELDALTAPRLDDAITSALRVPSIALIVDLSELDFLSSAGMASLVAGNRAAGGSKQFCVVADGPVTARPMKLIGLDSELRLYPSMDAALNAIH